MPSVRIELWSGQSRECKVVLMRNVTRGVVETVGCPPEAVEVLIYETDNADWPRGGISHPGRLPTANQAPYGGGKLTMAQLDPADLAALGRGPDSMLEWLQEMPPVARGNEHNERAE